uniref:Uncharacterized protein n=1 Tax=Alexandrium monilatum TaxID=311494 RepID=A0A7S4WHN4_9DINO
MVKGWQASQTTAWPSQPSWGRQEGAWPPQPPSHGGQEKGGWRRQLPQPPTGKGGKAAGPRGHTEAPWEEAEEAGEPELSATESFLRNDLALVQPRPGETERQAKVRAMAERIRAEARAAAQGRGGGEPGAAVATGGDADDGGDDVAATVGGALASPPPLNGGRAAGGGAGAVTGAGAGAAAERRREEKDAQRVQAMLPKLEERVSAAEDEAEKVTILAAPLAMEAVEELRELQLSSVRETERAVKAALGTVGKVRRELEARGKEVEAMAPLAKESAKEETAKLAARLDAVQARLDEHKSVRKDHELALQAEKLFGELASRLAAVEVDCEKAAMMAEPLGKALDTNPQEIGAAEIREAKEALRVAQATLAPTARLISGKVSGLKGAVRSKMLDLQSRAEASQALLDRTQRTVEEAQSRAAALPILRQAQERAAAVEEVLQKMRETEAPFLMGIETMPPEEAGEVLSRMDRAAALAQGALADAAKYVSLKAVEVGRLAEGAAEAARRELEGVRKQLDEGLARVRAFQAEATKRRRLNLAEAVRARLAEAEAAVTRMRDAGAALSHQQQQQAGAPEGSEGPAAALERAHAAELEAQNAVAAARREFQEKQQDMRPLDGGHPDVLKGSEVLRTKVRVNYMETELTKFRKLAKEFEEKLKVGRSLAEVLESLRDAEEEVDRISAGSEEWPEDVKPPEEAEKGIDSIQSKLSATTVQVETKLQTAQGLELRELRGIFSRLQRAQAKLERVKDASRERSRSLSMRAVREAADAVRAAEAAVGPLAAAAAGHLGGLPLPRLEALHEQTVGAGEAVAAARAALAQSQGLETAAKVELARLQLRFRAAERKSRAASEAAAAHFERAATAATQQALDALRATARKEDGSYDAEGLFAEISDGTGEVAEAQFCGFLARQHGAGGEPAVPAEKARLAFRKIAPHGSLMRRAFVSSLADFMTVAREITITDEFEIQSAKKVRKLEVGELVEALGESKDDGSLGLQRVRCRAVRDGTAGWVTVRSTAGASYLERRGKPFLWCAKDAALRSEAEARSALARDLRAGEVLELLEGPRVERLGSDLRVRGAACGDEAAGWLQVQDGSGGVLAKLSPAIYRCSEAIAMTDTADFGSCTMVRRIDAGEALELLDGEEEARPSEGGARRKFRACRDGAEGWVTVRGSQGTVYVKPAPRHYVCTQASPLHVGLGAESAVVRILMPGEAFAGFEEPREVAGGETTETYKARALLDGREGWVTATSAGEVLPWSARCQVLRTVPLTRGFPANEAAEVIEVLRLLEPGEAVDVTELPAEDSSSGLLRACCVARKDKAVGWVTVREGATLLLRPAAGAGEGEKAGAEAEGEKTGEGPGEAGAPRSGPGEAAPTTPPGRPGARPTKRPWQPTPGGPAAGKGAQKGWPGARPPMRAASPPAKRFKGKGKAGK